MKIKRYALCVVAILMAVAQQSGAENVRMYSAGEVPQASEIANILSGGKTMQKPKMKMRGISLDPAAEAEPKVSVNMDSVAQPSSTVVGLPVEFAFGSADILPKNRPQLDAVAEGIKQTNGIKVVVEGHTDAHGRASYNDYLSQKRAKAVKDYLVRKHGIDPGLLVVDGRGSASPINAADPFAAENRRVQLRAAN